MHSFLETVVTVLLLPPQGVVVRPGIARRSNLVLAAADVPRSWGHQAYIVIELPKALAPRTGGLTLIIAQR